MKASILTLILASLLLGMGSCGSNPTGFRATGTAYEIIVVANPDVWNNDVGSILKEQLLAPVSGLPAPENAMRVTHVQPAQFKGMFTYVRNILMVNVDDTQFSKVSVKSEGSRWAQGQVVVYMNAPDEAMLYEFLDEHPRLLVDFFTKIEMERMAEVLQKAYSKPVMDKLMTKFDVMLNAPSDINAMANDSTPDFFWASNNANSGRMDLVVYSFPYTDPNTFTREYLLEKRNAILGAHIPGSLPDSYMSTNSDWVTYTPITLYGKYCGVLRGLWETEGDMMGGPFVSYARLDEVNNRVIVAEGFVYAPETDKKNYIRRLEASLHTLRLPAEIDTSLEGPELNI